MKKQLIGLAMSLALSAATLPAFAQCPCPVATDPCCDTCQSIHTTAGVVNYNKDAKRTNWELSKKKSNLATLKNWLKKQDWLRHWIKAIIQFMRLIIVR